MSNCLFCAIAAGSIAADRVLDEDQVVAFLRRATLPEFQARLSLSRRRCSHAPADELRRQTAECRRSGGRWAARCEEFAFALGQVGVCL